MTEAALKLRSSEADFGLQILACFGRERFTVQQFYKELGGGRHNPYPFAAEREQLERRLNAARVLEPAPGARGGQGWKLRAAAITALAARQRVVQRRRNAARDQDLRQQAARRAIIERPTQLTYAHRARLGELGIAPAVVDELMEQVEAIIQATLRAGTIAR